MQEKIATILANKKLLLTLTIASAVIGILILILIINALANRPPIGGQPLLTPTPTTVEPIIGIPTVSPSATPKVAMKEVSNKYLNISLMIPQEWVVKEKLDYEGDGYKYMTLEFFNQATAPLFSITGMAGFDEWCGEDSGKTEKILINGLSQDLNYCYQNGQLRDLMVYIYDEKMNGTGTLLILGTPSINDLPQVIDAIKSIKYPLTKDFPKPIYPSIPPITPTPTPAPPVTLKFTGANWVDLAGNSRTYLNTLPELSGNWGSPAYIYLPVSTSREPDHIICPAFKVYYADQTELTSGFGSNCVRNGYLIIRFDRYDISKASLTIKITAPSHPGADYQIEGGSYNVSFSFSPQLADLPDGIFNGRIVDQNQIPQKEVTVKLYKIENDQKSLVGTTTSDTKGYFEFSGLAVNPYGGPVGTSYSVEFGKSSTIRVAHAPFSSTDGTAASSYFYLMTKDIFSFQFQSLWVEAN